MKKLLLLLSTLITTSTLANDMCPVGEVLTEDGCRRVIQQVQPKNKTSNHRDPRLSDRRCYDDGHFDPYDDDCLRAYPEFAPKGGYKNIYDDDRFDDDRNELWDD